MNVKCIRYDSEENNVGIIFDSNYLLRAQQNLQTYSLETSILLETVKRIVEIGLDDSNFYSTINFTANFGEPLQNNKQNIYISVTYPLDLGLVITRELKAGKLVWTAKVKNISSLHAADVKKRLIEIEDNQVSVNADIITQKSSPVKNPRGNRRRVSL